MKMGWKAQIQETVFALQSSPKRVQNHWWWCLRRMTTALRSGGEYKASTSLITMATVRDPNLHGPLPGYSFVNWPKLKLKNLFLAFYWETCPLDITEMHPRVTIYAWWVWIIECKLQHIVEMANIAPIDAEKSIGASSYCIDIADAA